MKKEMFYFGLGVIVLSPILGQVLTNLHISMFGYMNSFHGIVMVFCNLSILIIGISLVIASFKQK